MKKTITAFAMAALLLPNILSIDTVLAEESNSLGIQQDQMVDESVVLADLYKPMILTNEEYNGYYIIREFKYADSNDIYTQLIELPESITKQVDVKDEDSVAKATALLAQYYSHESINNISRLNEVLLSQVSEYPLSEISVSKEYRPIFAENLKYALDTLVENKEVSIPEEEREFLTSYFNEELAYETKDELLTATNLWYDDLRIKWYEKTSSYIVIGIAIVSASAFIVYKRR